MSLDDVVNVVITRESSSLTLPGFGTPMILGQHSHFAERLRYYTRAADLLTDGFLTTDAIYLEALAMLSQSPRPTRIAVGRRATPVAQTQLIVVPASPSNTTLYTVILNGTTISYTTDGSATQAELQAGILAAINASVWAPLLTATTATNDVLVTADTAGISFTLTIGVGTPALTLPAQTRLFTTPAAPGNSTRYRITINGAHCDFTTDASATQAELRDGMIAAINAAVGSAVTASASGTDVLVTADVAGANFSYSIDAAPATNPFALGAGTGATPNVGISEDLAAISEEQDDWYGLAIVERDAASILIAAAAIESVRKLFFAQSSDSGIIGAVYNSSAANEPATDIGTRLANLNYARTSLWYTPSDTNELASAILAQDLARVPGSYTSKFKELAGVTATKLTATQRTNLIAKFANGYEPLASRTMTYEGTVAENEYIDIIHGVDKLHSRVQQLNAITLLKNLKVPFTSGGIETLAADVRTAMQESVTDGLIAATRTLADGSVVPGFTVTPPRIQDIPAVDRAARTLTSSHPIVGEGTLQGAIHSLNVTISLSV